MAGNRPRLMSLCFCILLAAGLNTSWASEIQKTVAKGKALAQQHCVRCHLLPHANDLPKDRWGQVMDWMSYYVGLGDKEEPIPRIVVPAFIPPVPLMTTDEFASIQAYFEFFAEPEIEPAYVEGHGPMVNTRFVPSTHSYFPDSRMVSAVLIDEENGHLYSSEGNEKQVVEFNPRGEVVARIDCRGGMASRLAKEGGEVIVTLAGGLGGLGTPGAITTFEPGINATNKFILEGWSRLAHSARADLDGDGYRDWVLSGFGSFDDGSLSIFWGTAEGTLGKQTVLYSKNGTLNTVLVDMDKDGRMDILSLTAQGYHELAGFQNLGNRQFRRHHLMKNRPGFGANGFEMEDLNGDGRAELIIFCGNNLELSNPPVRPYHGIYIYEEIGLAQYKEVSFTHFPGAVAIEIADFNGDEMPDMAAVSLFPDWRQARPLSLLIMEGQGDFKYELSTVAMTRGAQWTSMDSGDIDQDGDIDLILGGANIAPAMDAEKEAHIRLGLSQQKSLLLLENNTIQN